MAKNFSTYILESSHFMGVETGPSPCLTTFIQQIFIKHYLGPELQVARDIIVIYTGTGPTHTGTSGLISPPSLEV